jgi:cytoskeletal protein RodZ
MSIDHEYTEATDMSDMSEMPDLPDTPGTDGRPVLETIGDPGGAPERLVEVRRRPVLAAALGAGASLVALAYLARAAGGGGLLDWVLGTVLGLIGVANLVALVDARTPLLVADDLGVRLRLGRTWVGLPWGGLHEIDHASSDRWWRDGLLTVRTHYVQRILEDLDPGARRTARVNRRLHRSPLAVPIGLGTRVIGAPFGLTGALRELADGRTPVVETMPVSAVVEEEPLAQEPVVEQQPVPEEQFLPEEPAEVPPVGEEEPRARRLPDPRPALAELIGRMAARFDRPDAGAPELVDGELVHGEHPAFDLEDREIVASATPSPVRETSAAARTEVTHESRADLGEVLGEDTQLWDVPHDLPDAAGPLVIGDDPADQPGLSAHDPVIGPQFAAARGRLGLTVDELAERTRIRPHVIEAIEVDDFAACGGDFYARGHLRTLARVLGVEGAPMLATYDERYADAPIDPRAVFEADLAGAGTIRATRGGPNWSVLVAAVMALVLCWSVARLVTGGPGRSSDEAVLSGSGGPNHSRSVLTKPVPVTITAAGGGARVVVRDGLGRLVFTGDLAYGQQHTVRASPPVRIQSTDGSVQVSVDGQDRGRMGPAGRPSSKTYVGRR